MVKPLEVLKMENKKNLNIEIIDDRSPELIEKIKRSEEFRDKTRYQTKRELKVLIVEDDGESLEALEDVVSKTMPNSNYDVVRSYEDARALISNTKYDLVLLDNRLPWEFKHGHPYYHPQGRRSDGYELIPLIKEQNPSTVIVGTSSCDEYELQFYEDPDFAIKKYESKAAESGLEKVLKQTNL